MKARLAWAFILLGALRKAQSCVGNECRIKVGQRLRWINWIAPNPSPLSLGQRPKGAQGYGVCEVRGKIAVGHNSDESRPRNMLDEIGLSLPDRGASADRSSPDIEFLV